jgi:3-hydroxyacyl-[acyl-carrier-protein] dehydratase
MSAANNDLFTIESMTHEDGAIKATLIINADCGILKGHFPGHPVVPGACMLQIIKEVLENALQTPLRLKKADQLKFMTMIDPTNTSEVQLDISYKQTEDNTIAANAKLSNIDTVYFKLQGSFIKIP